MAFNEKEQEIIRWGLQNGKSKEQVTEAITKYRAGTPSNQVPAQQSTFKDRIVSDIKERGVNVVEAIKGEGEFAGQSPVQRGIEATAETFGAIPSTVSNVLPEPVRNVMEKIGDKIGEGFEAVAEKLGDTKLFKEAVESGDTGKLEEILSSVTAGGEIAGSILAVEGGMKSGKAVTTGAQKVRDTIAKNTEELFIKVPKLGNVSGAKERLSNFFSRDLEGKAATILKETPTEKFDSYMKIAEEAVSDPRKLTPFEAVGDKAVEATKQLQNQIKSLSQQKKTIISKAKVGLEDFSKQTGTTILDVRRAVGESKIGAQVINKLKKVKTKLDADNTIDDIQDMIYKGNKDMTIPVGSAEDKALRGIIGKYNSALKEALPKSYATLNDEISSRIKVVGSLNKALGEVVDGVSTKGSGLIKQFFSPSGRKAKELFEYIKENTGVDLAQDATLARFTMEMFEDARARALLEGIPTSTGGLMKTAVDFVVEKTGAGKKVKDALDQATAKKARRLTIPTSNE